MSLEPCKVCGTLNPAETQICISCGNSTKGSKRPLIFRYVAIALVLAFILPLLVSSFSWIRLRLMPEPDPPRQQRVS